MIREKYVSMFQLQQKYHQNMLKQNKLTRPPLADSINIPSPQKARLSKQDPLVGLISEQISSGQGNLLEVILDDPMLSELNQSLEKEAEQQKKVKLLESFPFRYRNLVHTEILYKKLQAQNKEQLAESREVIELLQKQQEELKDQIQYMRSEAEQRDKQRVEQRGKIENDKQAIVKEWQVRVAEKDKEIRKCMQTVQDAENKMSKIKAQKQNLLEYLEQLKEQAETVKAENNRIIQAITAKELEASHNELTIALLKQSHSKDVEQLKAELAHSTNQLNAKIAEKNKENSQLTVMMSHLRRQLKDNQTAYEQLEGKLEETENQKHNELQDARMRLLEEVKQKNCAEDEYERQKEQDALQMQELQAKIWELERELQKNHQILADCAHLHQQELDRLKSMAHKLEQSKNETIQQVRKEEAAAQTQISQLLSTIKQMEDQIHTLQSKVQKQREISENYVQQLATTQSQGRKSDQKSKEIEKMIAQFKQQLLNYNAIIEEKEQKIQQYRKDILALRSKQKQLLIQKDTTTKQMQQLQTNMEKSEQERDLLIDRVAKLSIAQLQNSQLLATLQFRPQTCDSHTQVELIAGLNDQQQLELELLVKELQKKTLKYDNLFEELQQYKKQFKQELQQRDQIIAHLQQEAITLRQVISDQPRPSSVDFEGLLDTKVSELKGFYDVKIEEQARKYRGVIDTLRKEMTELYEQIDLKKSMEEQVYLDIMRINQQRNEKQRQTN